MNTESFSQITTAPACVREEGLCLYFSIPFNKRLGQGFTSFYLVLGVYKSA